MKLIPLKLADGTAAIITVVCKATRERGKWNEAVALGWVADADGEAFNAYYSPEGALLAEDRRKLALVASVDCTGQDEEWPMLRKAFGRPSES